MIKSHRKSTAKQSTAKRIPLLALPETLLVSTSSETLHSPRCAAASAGCPPVDTAGITVELSK